MDEDEFRRRAGLRRLGTVRTVRYEPDNDPPLHAHKFTALLLVTSGELVLGFEDRSVTLEPGDVCEVPAGTLHAERTGGSPASALLATD